MRWILAIGLALLILPVVHAEVHEVKTVRTGDSDVPFAFEPAELQIEVGDTVRWVNGDGVYHTTTSRGSAGTANGDIWSGVLASEGATFEHTFTEAGAFEYFCQPHATFMEGQITVGLQDDGGRTQQESAGLPVLFGLGALTLVAALRRR